jgi:beta-lactamase class D
MIQRFSVFVLIVCLAYACSPNNVKNDPNIVKLLDSAKVNGVFAIMENGSGQFTITDLILYKDSSYAPLNTFFSMPILLGLDKGYIKHDTSSWVSLDSVNYYNALIEKIGRSAILKSIDSLHYGKGIVSNDLNSFWKNGSLRITADEQLGFIKKLYFGQLAFQKKSQDLFKKMILKEDNASYQLSYMLGSDKTNEARFWIVGYVEENKHPYFFVMHFETKNTAFDNDQAVSLLKSILLQQGFLKGVR